MQTVFRGGLKARPGLSGGARRNARIGTMLLVCVAGTVSATEVYRSTGPGGEPSFSYQPGTDARPVTIMPPALVYEAPAPRPSAPPAAAEQGELPPAFEVLRITSPAPESVHWKASGPLVVSVLARPALAAGEVSVLTIDGVEQARALGAARLSVPVETLNPGEHRLAVEVLNADGQTIGRTDAVRIYLRQHNLNMPTRRPPPTTGGGGAP